MLSAGNMSLSLIVACRVACSSDEHEIVSLLWFYASTGRDSAVSQSVSGAGV